MVNEGVEDGVWVRGGGLEGTVEGEELGEEGEDECE